MAKIIDNKAAAEALAVTKSAMLSASASNVPDIARLRAAQAAAKKAAPKAATKKAPAPKAPAKKAPAKPAGKKAKK